jgi:hypothetical protein
MAWNSKNTSLQLETRYTNELPFTLFAWNDALPVVTISVSILYCAVRLMCKLCIDGPPSPPSTEEDNRMAVTSEASDPDLIYSMS